MKHSARLADAGSARRDASRASGANGRPTRFFRRPARQNEWAPIDGPLENPPENGPLSGRPLRRRSIGELIADAGRTAAGSCPVAGRAPGAPTDRYGARLRRDGEPLSSAGIFPAATRRPPARRAGVPREKAAHSLGLAVKRADVGKQSPDEWPGSGEERDAPRRRTKKRASGRRYRYTQTASPVMK